MATSFNNAAWLRALWRSAAPGVPSNPFVASVQLVNDRLYESSREGAPLARDFRNYAAAGAGEHNYIEIGSTDGQGGFLLAHALHQLRVIAEKAAATDQGAMSLAFATPGSLTTVSRTAQTPTMVETSDSITPTMFVGTITTANLPAVRFIPPGIGAPGATNATPLYANFTHLVDPIPNHHFALRWLGNQSLFVFAETAASKWVVDVSWQGMRS